MSIPPDLSRHPEVRSFGRPSQNSAAFYAAIACGALPLSVGAIIYLLWRLTWWDWLMGAGIGTIGSGLVLVFLGSLCLVKDFIDGSSRTLLRPPRRVDVLAAVVLIANFPAAAFCLYSAEEVRTRYTVEVFNETNGPISSFVLTGPGVSTDLGPIAAGQHVRWHLHFHGSGPLNFAAKQQTEFKGQLDGYVSSDWPGHKLIQVRGPATCSIEEGPNSPVVRLRDRMSD
jgi:hypothetical protein